MDINHVEFFTGNHAINCALIGWAIAQIIKVILTFISSKRIDVGRFVGSGGMPSSHTSAVIALATAIGNMCGIHSVEFALAFTFAAVIMYDATGVRRAAGEQAKILNYMMQHWREEKGETIQKDLKELLGHTPIEVIAGIFVGIGTAFLLGYLCL